MAISEKKKQKKKKETKKKKKTEEKNKEPKLSVRRVWSNNLFALSLIAKAAPWYLPVWFGWSVLNAISGFLTGSYLLRIAINNVQDNVPYEKTLVYIVIFIAVALLCSIITRIFSRYVVQILSIKISASVKKVMLDKAKNVELACYEKPEFYDRYVRAMAEANDRVQGVVETVDRLIYQICTLSLNSFLLFAIDPVLIIFGILPIIFGLLRKIEMKAYYRYENDQKPNNRKKDYIRRTFYQNDYAKEMRLTNMAKTMYRDYAKCWEEYKKI